MYALRFIVQGKCNEENSSLIGYSIESYMEGYNPRKALLGGIMFSTNVTLGSFLPIVP